MANEKHQPFTTNKPGVPILPGRNTPLIQTGAPKNVPAPAKPAPAAAPAPVQPIAPKSGN